MANEEHLAILMQGVAAWNRWRDAYREIQPDLIGADLAGANLTFAHLGDADLTKAHMSKAVLANAWLVSAKLSYADLSRTDLNHAELTGANLSNADLSGSNLRDANLTGADLFDAILRNADLRAANLTNAHLYNADLSDADLTSAFLTVADLTRAKLGGTNLSRTILAGTDMSNVFLQGANLDGAFMSGTILGGTSLRQVMGLETISHDEPSTIGIDTIIRSQGTISGDFLQGAGVPENFVEMLRAFGWIQQLPQPSDSFISYSSKDTEFVSRFYSDLKDNGVQGFLAQEDMRAGEDFWERIYKNIGVCDTFIVILSEHSIASRWVKREFSAARERNDREGKPIIIPIKLDEAVESTKVAWAVDIRTQLHIKDFTGWQNKNAYGKAFERLLRDLKDAANPA